MAPSIQELNTPSNTIWDFFNNNRGEGQGPSRGDLPPWASFFQAPPPGQDHGPLPARGMPPMPPHPHHGPTDDAPPSYPRPWYRQPTDDNEDRDATPATEPAEKAEKADHPMNDDNDNSGPSGAEGEHAHHHRHGHRHARGHGGRGRGAFGGGRGREWGAHGGCGGRGGRGWGGRGNWPQFIQEMARAGMGPVADFYKQNMPNHPFAQWARDGDAQEFTPPVDVFDTADAYEIHVSLPGAKKENIAVSYNVEESTIVVTGIVERRGDADFIRSMAMSERQVGAFERKVRLGTRTEPAAVDDAQIGAKLEDGVLRVVVPKVLKEEGFVDVRKVDIL